MVENETIDLTPKYQRRERWDIARQSELIESFLLIDIPQMTSKFAGVVLPIHRHGNSVPFVALRCGDFGGLIKFGTPFGKVFHHLDAPLPSFSPLR